jgi:aminoglycoside phosphotransferase (APT) family kinase protein
VTALAPEVERELAAFEAGRAMLRAGAVAVPLVGGLTNRTWRVTSREADWVLRLGGSRDAALAIDRRAELVAVRAAAERGLAPRCVHAAAARGVLVLEYVAGTVWSRAMARSYEGAERVGAWLRELHAVPVPAGLPDVDPRTTIPGYLARPFAVAGPVPRATLARRAGEALRGYVPGGRAFCHHDVHHLNVVASNGFSTASADRADESGDAIVPAGRLLLLDWEYAGAGDPAMDLAAYVGYHDLDGPARECLLAAYGPAVTRDQLYRACEVFDCLQALWHDAAGSWDRLEDDARHALVGRLSGSRTTRMDSR